MRKQIPKVPCEKCGREIQKNNYQKHLNACDGKLKEPFRKLEKCPYCSKDLRNIKGGNHVRWCEFGPNDRKYKKGRQAWNKGETKETNEIVKKISETRKKLIKEGKITICKRFKGGHKHTQETRDKLSKSQKKRFEEGKHKGWALINSDINRRSYPEKWFIKNVIEKYNLHNKFTIREKFSFGKYFFDFAFLELSLDVEIDGGQHDFAAAIEHDRIRDEFTRSKNWTVCRLKWKNLKENKEEELKKFLELVL